MRPGAPSLPVILSEAQRSRKPALSLSKGIYGTFRCGKGGTLRSNLILGVVLASALPLCSQYPGQISETGKTTPELRSFAVLEWTGELGHPKTSRLVPVAVFDSSRLEGDQLQDGGIYMARPEPLALGADVEYVLQQEGRLIGLFDIKNAGQEQGSWVGFGAWKPLPAPKPKPSMNEVARSRIDDEDSYRPILYRKHPADEGGTQNGGEGSSSTGPAPAPDPDRPTLHRTDSSDGSGDTGTTSTASAPAPDPDRPTLHKKDSSDSAGSGSASAGAPTDDPDRPVLKRSTKKQPEDAGHVESLPDLIDPNRPRLLRGKPAGDTPEVLPTLMGLPADMEQAVAVSDAMNRPPHPWNYSWANPDDEAKMKSDLEEIARDALGLNPAAPAPKRTTAHKAARKAAKPLPPPAPPPLVDEHFRVFELTYGSGVTMVLSAHTGGPFAQQKFVTLIAQPDLYGNVLVLLKNVTDGAHLDETPRMRLVDAVDALADNRGELLFELRGATQRQFALYRVLRGQAQKLFVTAASSYGTETSQ